jgi:hypothetical protein
MNKKFLIAIPLCLLGFYGTSQVTAQDPECEVVSVPPTCQGASRININTNSRNISPRNICVSPGQTFDVNVRPTGSVTIRGKDGGWPDASGASFSLTAPASGEYDYNVYFEDGTCIDPRITVD